MTAQAFLAVTLAALGLLFLLFAVLFAMKKEKACGLIAGFNALTKQQQAQYDRAAIARDYKKLFILWTAAAFVCAGLCLILGWIAYIAFFALLLATAAPHMHLWAEKAFAKYKIATDRKDDP
jgi:hypothetical protein